MKPTLTKAAIAVAVVLLATRKKKAQQETASAPDAAITTTPTTAPAVTPALPTTTLTKKPTRWWDKKIIIIPLFILALITVLVGGSHLLIKATHARAESFNEELKMKEPTSGVVISKYTKDVSVFPFSSGNILPLINMDTNNDGQADLDLIVDYSTFAVVQPGDQFDYDGKNHSTFTRNGILID